MKAIVLTAYGSPNTLEIKELPQPTPNDNEVLIKIQAASVNDWDWGMVRGQPFYMRLICGLLKPKFPIPGVDIAGQVETVGKNVTQFKPGDAVYGDLSDSGFGAFAEYVCVPEHAISLKPPGMAFIEAAALPHAAALAVQGLCDIGLLQPGQTLLINGAGGGVGTLGIQIAKHIGVDDVTGVDSAPKLALLRKMGFTHTLDYQEQDFTKNGQQYDLILDTKTTRSAFAYLRALTPNGTYVTVGGSIFRILQIALLGPLIRRFTQKELRVLGLKPNKGLAYINELFEAGKIKPIIDGPYALADVPKLIQYFGEGKHTGKVIVTMDADTKEVFP